MKATCGRGVDVVLNFLTGDLLHDTWRACAEFGRFVEIGKTDLTNGGRLDMDVFNRSVTYTAFDLSTLYHSEHPRHQTMLSKYVMILAKLYWTMTYTIGRLLHRSIELVRTGIIQMTPAPKIFDVADIVSAFRTLSLSSRTGKVVVSLENPDSLVKVSLFEKPLKLPLCDYFAVMNFLAFPPTFIFRRICFKPLHPASWCHANEVLCHLFLARTLSSLWSSVDHLVDMCDQLLLNMHRLFPKAIVQNSILQRAISLLAV